MTRPVFPYETQAFAGPTLGLVALQSDETIERDMRRLLPSDAEFMVSRVPSAPEVTRESLAAMEAHLGRAAALFPVAARLDVVGYGCTSGTAQIGAAVVAREIEGATTARAVTEPVSALIAACAHLRLNRLAFLSPYVEQVSNRLRQVLLTTGIETPVFGGFDVAEEATVARIAPASIVSAARDLMDDAEVDGLFVSCTNLRVLDIIPDLEAQTGKPVLSSNQVLAWHMTRLAGAAAPPGAPGRLFAR